MRRRSVLLAVAAGIACWPAAAQVSVDFEAASGYTAGQPLAGQQGWVEFVNTGAEIKVVYDNGPSAPGTQCVQLSTGGWPILTEAGVQLTFPDAVANGGRIITVRYDYRRVVLPTSSQCAVRLLSANIQHWWDNWNQFVGRLDHEGTGAGWTSHQWPVHDSQWHTIEWKFVWGDKYAGQCGYLVYDAFDGVPNTDHLRPYLAVDYTDDVSVVRLWIVDAYWEMDDDPPGPPSDVIQVDNLVITGEPLPSAMPVADAGPDQNLPGDWDGVAVTLDGSGSYDPDFTLQRYRWRVGEQILYDGDEPVVTVVLDAGATYDVLLEVFDSTGLMDADKCRIVIGVPPPIDDNVAGPWGIVFGDAAGTSASAQVPVLVDEGTPFQILDQRELGYWDGGYPEGGDNAFNFLFDRRGNLYWVAVERLFSFDKHLNYRWRGHYEDGREVTVAGRDSNPLIVGQRFIYAVGNTRDASDAMVPTVFAFNKAGVLQWETTIPNEPWQWRPKMTLYQDKLYIVGEVGATQFDHVHIYQVNATTGALEGDSEVFVELYGQWYDNPDTWWVDGPVGNAGSLILVPDVFGPGLHGLYWAQESSTYGGADLYPDMVGIQVDPATGTAAAKWGGGSMLDGPNNWASSVLYSSRTGALYTPSHNYWDGVSLYSWNPKALPDQQLIGTALGGDHAHRQVTALDEFTPGQTRIHTCGREGELYTYIDSSGNGTAFTIEKRVYDTRSDYFGPAGCLLYDGARGRPVLITAHRGDFAQVLALDPTAPIVGDPDDAGLYIDDVAILAGNSLNPATWTTLYSYDFESLSLGLLHGQEGWLGFSSEYDPDNVVPTQVVTNLPGGRPGKAVLQDPYGTEGTTWFEGWPFATNIDPMTPGNPAYGYEYVIVRWWQYRGDLTDNLRIYATYSIDGAYAWDGDRKYHALGWGGPTAPQTAGVWQQVDRIFRYDHSGGGDFWVRIRVDGVEDDPAAPGEPLGGAPVLDYLDFTVDATPATENGQPFIQRFEACYDNAEYPHYGHPVILSVGPDGSVYYVQHGWDWVARVTRLGAAAAACPGDFNCDGSIDFNDIDPFVIALVSQQCCDGTGANCDVNGDGRTDFGDIDPFVILLASGAQCP